MVSHKQKSVACKNAGICSGAARRKKNNSVEMARLVQKMRDIGVSWRDCQAHINKEFERKYSLSGIRILGKMGIDPLTIEHQEREYKRAKVAVFMFVKKQGCAPWKADTPIVVAVIPTPPAIKYQEKIKAFAMWHFISSARATINSRTASAAARICALEYARAYDSLGVHRTKNRCAPNEKQVCTERKLWRAQRDNAIQ